MPTIRDAATITASGQQPTWALRLVAVWRRFCTDAGCGAES